MALLAVALFTNTMALLAMALLALALLAVAWPDCAYHCSAQTRRIASGLLSPILGAYLFPAAVILRREYQVAFGNRSKCSRNQNTTYKLRCAGAVEYTHNGYTVLESNYWMVYCRGVLGSQPSSDLATTDETRECATDSEN